MQFVRNGPDVPERLLRLHEEGRVVFFCGAGISVPAGLPSFAELVDLLFRELGHTPDAVQAAAMRGGQFDTTVGLLENNVVGGRETVRHAIAKLLTSRAIGAEASATHRALLTLGRTRPGPVRLVTTNFDLLFEEVIRADALRVQTHAAPSLPVPKNQWDGLVYLHGRLGNPPSAEALSRLVVSSGDFGRAYLIERWAARFVSELFRTFTVCFVGYSIGDPVLRYMTDALAADRLLGESSREMFAFGSFSKGHELDGENEWLAKSVTPILYDDHAGHTYLHQTLSAWSETYRDGVRGKEQVVVQYARANPSGSTGQDDFVGRMRWAVSDPSGLPARRFAQHDPVPSLDWLEAFTKGLSGEDDTSTGGLIDRPAPSALTPRMRLVSNGSGSTGWDDVMRELARWLMRHLGDPKLLEWLARRGGRVEPDLAWEIRRALEHVEQLERQGNQQELLRLIGGAPNARPTPELRVYWRLLLAGRFKTRGLGLELYDWLSRLEASGLTPTLRVEVRGLLAPQVAVRGLIAPEDSSAVPEIDAEVVLAAEHVHSALAHTRSNRQWNAATHQLLADFNLLLRDALELMQEIGIADEHSDRSYVQQPSIKRHAQNRDFHDWTALIDLTRDAWLATVPTAPGVALLTAREWSRTPFPLFKRLAFFAASETDLIPADEALEWLLADEGWWLWSHGVQREVYQLLGPLARRLDAPGRGRLEQAIAGGPPRNLLREGIAKTLRERFSDRETWRRLAKLNLAGVQLGSLAADRLEALERAHPDWELAAGDHDEFAVLIREGGREVPASTPRSRQDLVAWVRENPKEAELEGDDWRQRCQVDFATTACALCSLANEGVWPVQRWAGALSAWSQKRTARRWHHVAPLLSTAPPDILRELARDVSGWLRACAEALKTHETLFLELCRRILMMDDAPSAWPDDPLTQALNDPVGQVTEALLLWAYQREVRDNQRLDERLVPLFTTVCDSRTDRLRHGRVLLAAHAVTLFRVDPQWTRDHLLPLFNWKSAPAEAPSAWAGFLWSPRLHRPLFEELKEAFLLSARNFAALGKLGPQYAALLTFAALDRGDTFSEEELAAAMHALPNDGLDEAARSLVHALDGAGTQRADYWTNRVAPLIARLWPKETGRRTDGVAHSFARLCVTAGSAFPSAFQLLRPWLQPRALHDHEVALMRETGLCVQAPEECVQILDACVGDAAGWVPRELAACLEEIAQARGDLRSDARFQRLEDLARRGR